MSRSSKIHFISWTFYHTFSRASNLILGLKIQQKLNQICTNQAKISTTISHDSHHQTPVINLANNQELQLTRFFVLQDFLSFNNGIFEILFPFRISSATKDLELVYIWISTSKLQQFVFAQHLQFFFKFVQEQWQ